MEENIKQADAEIEKILSERKLKIGYELVFPRYNHPLPTEVELALSVLRTHGMNVIFSLTPQDPEEPKK